ncbi:MAG TPA: hypothetical protein VGG29_14335 [Caulobacteraceae bacterium]|jgi:hypothetical protein
MVARKVTLEVDEMEIGQSPPAVFELGTSSSGTERLLLDVPDQFGDLFGRICKLLPPPYYVMYVLHTPRGEGDTGRYQSTELSLEQLGAFLERYERYLAGDARHDIWTYSITSRQTAVWDRHNRLYVERGPLGDVADSLVRQGFIEGKVQPIGNHYHHYRPEFDDDAAAILAEFDWHRTPLRPEDEQRPPIPANPLQ